MAKMLSVCENYAGRNNLQFSTDPNPSKSKSKCVFMTGTRLRKLSKPVPLQLYGVDLHWVASATHKLHQDCSMDYDSKSKRGRFIENSTAIRETFKSAHREQILKSIQVHCFDMYGSILWDIFSPQAAQYYRCCGWYVSNAAGIFLEAPTPTL